MTFKLNTIHSNCFQLLCICILNGRQRYDKNLYLYFILKYIFNLRIKNL